MPAYLAALARNIIASADGKRHMSSPLGDRYSTAPNAGTGTNVIAITMKHRALKNRRKYFSLSGYSDEIEYIHTDGRDTPVVYGNRYRDVMTHWTIRTLPTKGVLWERTGNTWQPIQYTPWDTSPDGLQYIPNTDQTGADSFTYSCTDSSGSSPSRAMHFTILNAWADAPCAAALPALALTATPSIASFVEGTDWYVDNSHASASDSNVGGKGSPSLPRLTFPANDSTITGRVWFAGGVTTPYRLRNFSWHRLNLAGTAENPAMLIGIPTGGNLPRIIPYSTRELIAGNQLWLRGDFYIVENLDIQNITPDCRSDIVDYTSDDIVFRDTVVWGQYWQVNGTALNWGSVNGQGDRKAMINVYLHHDGKFFEDAADENDVHGFISPGATGHTGTYANGCWIYDSLVHDVAGDGCQVNGSINAYVCFSQFYSCGENAIDHKNYTDHFAYGNYCWDLRAVDYASGSGSDGTALIANSDGPMIRMYFVNNQVWDCTNGIRCQGEQIYFVGNTLWHIHHSTNKSSASWSVSIGNSGGTYSQCTLVNNTFIKCDGGINAWGGSATNKDFKIAGNFFGALNSDSLDKRHFIGDQYNMAYITLFDYNVFEDATTVIQWNGTNRDLAWMIANTDHCTNSSAGVTPLFVDAASMDFRLQTGSPLRGVNAANHPCFDEFESLYTGLSIRFDRDGTAIPPSGTADIGAFQYA